MSPLKPTARNFIGVITQLIFLIGIAVGLAACGAEDSPMTVSASPGATITNILTTETPMFPTPTRGLPPPSATPNATVAFEEFKAGFPRGAFANPTGAAAGTEIAQHRAYVETVTALTPSPTTGPTETPAPTETPVPTATYGVGMITDDQCIRELHGGAPRYPSCWDAYVNGSWLFVAAGDNGGGNPGDPPLIGLLLVCPEPASEHYLNDSITYETPAAVGEIHIIAVNGALVTVAPRDPNIHETFVFDLTTRQWVTSTPGLSPTP